MAQKNKSDSRTSEYREQFENPKGNWPAKRILAQALRKLVNGLSASNASQEHLHAIANEIELASERLSSPAEGTANPAESPDKLPGGMEIFADRSPVVGLSNPLAPPVTLEANHETQLVQGSVFFGPAYEGAPGCVHGGFISATLDEALGVACAFAENPGMTAELTVRFRRPTPTEVPLRIEARLDRQEGRRTYTSGELYAGEQKLVEAKGLFISMPPEGFGDLRAAQLERQGNSKAEN